MYEIRLILALFLLFQSVHCENILLLMHLQGSHVSELSTVGKELIDRGYAVYTVLPDITKHNLSLRKKGLNVINYKAIPGEMYMDSEEFDSFINTNIFLGKGLSMETALVAEQVSKLHCSRILHNVTLIDQLKELKFKVAYIDTFTINFCLLLVPEVLGVPYISTTTGIEHWNFGIPGFPSFVPAPLQDTGRIMTFTDKIKSLASNLIMHPLVSFIRQDTELLVKFGQKFSDWNELLRRSKMVVCLRNELMEWPQILLPHILYLPGVTYEPARSLPQSIDSIFSRSINGVIFMSFGSTAGALPVTIFKIFLDAFRQLRQYDVVWKFPPELLQREDFKSVLIPENVHLFQWLPQNDCLGHNKTVLFITHCGNNGQYESLYHGVPMIGFPLFADQFHNAFRTSQRGYGLQLPVNSFSSADLVSAVHEVLNNVSFSQKVKWAQRIMTSQPHPKEVIADWIVHVSKYGGDHLRSSSLDLPWYKLILLDVFLPLTAIVSLIILAIIMCIKRICKSFITNPKYKNRENAKKTVRVKH